MHAAVQQVHNELYSSPEKIADNLMFLVQTLKTASEDIRILGAMYILELLESKDSKNQVRKVLVSNKVLKHVYLNVIDLKQDYKTKQNIEFSVLCGKIIAAIGLQHSFVNDNVYLKATNQKTLIQTNTDLTKQEEKKYEINVKSDYYNPITNQVRNMKKRDDTLELLAIPIMNQIKIEREDDLKFAIEIYKKICEVSNLSDDLPKNYFFSQFCLIKYNDERRV